MRVFKIIITSLLATALLASCNNDNNTLNKAYYSLAVVDNPANSSFFYFTTDSGKRMYASATAVPYFRPATGVRILASYAILSDEAEGSAFDHQVRLNDAYRILTKDIVEITQENEEEIGNDPIEIEDVWISNDYLNVEFWYLGNNRSHTINLGENSLEAYDDSKTHLEFRHNANGDHPYYWRWGMASFRLQPLQGNAQSPLTIVVHTRDYDNPAGRDYELEYYFGQQDTSVRRYEVKDAGEIQ